ncbi:hypothetical protein [Novosphingobium sp. PC22D]|nr:hypothetical protein [Novosphingobium sp. PC22D]
MTFDMRWGWLLAGLGVCIALLLAYAWVDGGREPVRDIVETVPLPELTK